MLVPSVMVPLHLCSLLAGGGGSGPILEKGSRFPSPVLGKGSRLPSPVLGKGSRFTCPVLGKRSIGSENLESFKRSCFDIIFSGNELIEGTISEGKTHLHFLVSCSESICHSLA